MFWYERQILYSVSYFCKGRGGGSLAVATGHPGNKSCKVVFDHIPIIRSKCSVVSLVAPRLEEAILAPVLKKIFKRPSTLTSYWRYLLLFYEMNYFSTNVTPIAAKRTSWIPPPGANSSVAAWLPSSERGGGMFAHFQPPTKVVIAHFWMFQGHLGIHAKNVWCCGEGYFGQIKFAEKVRESRQNVNRDKSA